MHIGNKKSINAYHINGRLLNTTSCEKDLGVVISDTLKTAAHTNMVFASARRMLSTIRRSFTKLTMRSFRLLYSTHVRPRLEYGASVAYTCTLGEMKQIERVQRAATRMVDDIGRMEYTDRLDQLNLFPQHYRRARGDIITLRAILRKNLVPELLEDFPLRNDLSRRGHVFTIKKESVCKLSATLRLSRRVINLWNSLPAVVVEEVNDETFKRKLDEQLGKMWCRDRS